jgi:hypothetical protein
MAKFTVLAVAAALFGGGLLSRTATNAAGAIVHTGRAISQLDPHYALIVCMS